MKYDARLETERLVLRPWTLTIEDMRAFHRMDSDEEMMRFFPWRSSRSEAEVKLQRLIEIGKEVGLSWAAACLKETGEPIGLTGLWHVNFEAHFTPAVEIGWRYFPEHWRKGYATEAANELLRHGFEDLNLSEIVSFAVHNNLGSINIMKKVGMVEDPTSPFDFHRVPDTHPDLKQHVLYRITREDWRAIRSS